MWLSTNLMSAPPRSRNFASENARNIRNLQREKQDQRRREQEEQLRPRQPLKATLQYKDVQPRVNTAMNGITNKEKRPFLQGHAKTGPFLGENSRRENYRTRRRTPHSRSEVDLPGLDQLQYETHSRAESRFGDFSVEERRARIRDMVMEIGETPPIGGLNSSAPSRRHNGDSRATTIMSREQVRSIKREGIPAMTVNGNGGNLMKSRSMSSLNKQPAATKVTTGVQTSPEFPKQVQASQRQPSSVEGRVNEPQPPKLDEGTRRELRLNLDDLALSDDTTEDEEEPATGSSGKLPVVKGLGIDYIHANKDGASAMGQRKRRPDKDSGSSTAKPPSSYKAGSVPRYLQSRKQKWQQEAERVEREKPDHDCPSGHVRLSEEDRVKTLSGLNDRYSEVLVEVNSFPVRSDTLRVRERKKELEIEMNHLDEAIRTYSRNVVYVRS